MATEFLSHIGSGNQPFRKEFHGSYHRPGMGVNILNWEDAIPVYQVRTLGFEVGDVGLALPSGTDPLATRRVIAIYNTDGTNTLYIGQSGVTSDSGYPVGPGTEKAIAIAANLPLWGICASGQTCNVRIMEIA